jgi:hypothetical protein
MALINCPECGKEVSDKATVCPSCAFPLVKQQQHVVTSTAAEQTLAFPGLPADLNIGKLRSKWSHEDQFKGEFVREADLITDVPSGKVTVQLHVNGINISSGNKEMHIHRSQVISLKSVTRGELVNIEKSVIGRAVVGSLFFGNAGAIVGGLSGLSNTKKVQDMTYLVINYWEKETAKPKSILINGKEGRIQSYIEVYNNPETKKGSPAGLFLILFLIALVAFCIAMS